MDHDPRRVRPIVVRGAQVGDEPIVHPRHVRLVEVLGPKKSLSVERHDVQRAYVERVVGVAGACAVAGHGEPLGVVREVVRALVVPLRGHVRNVRCDGLDVR